MFRVKRIKITVTIYIVPCISSNEIWCFIDRWPLLAWTNYSTVSRVSVDLRRLNVCVTSTYCLDWTEARSSVKSPHKGQWRRALSKQSWGWWFEKLSRSLWCHCNAYTLRKQYFRIQSLELLGRQRRSGIWIIALWLWIVLINQKRPKLWTKWLAKYLVWINGHNIPSANISFSMATLHSYIVCILPMLTVPLLLKHHSL